MALKTDFIPLVIHLPFSPQPPAVFGGAEPPLGWRGNAPGWAAAGAQMWQLRAGLCPTRLRMVPATAQQDWLLPAWPSAQGAEQRLLSAPPLGKGPRGAGNSALAAGGVSGVCGGTFGPRSLDSLQLHGGFPGAAQDTGLRPPLPSERRGCSGRAHAWAPRGGSARRVPPGLCAGGAEPWTPPGAGRRAGEQNWRGFPQTEGLCGAERTLSREHRTQPQLNVPLASRMLFLAEASGTWTDPPSPTAGGSLKAAGASGDLEHP